MPLEVLARKYEILHQSMLGLAATMILTLFLLTISILYALNREWVNNKVLKSKLGKYKRVQMFITFVSLRNKFLLVLYLFLLVLSIYYLVIALTYLLVHPVSGYLSPN